MEKDENKLRASAIYYAKNFGWYVFPCHVVKDGKCTCGKACGSPGKHPRTKNGFADGSQDIGQIMRWWAQWPEANVGIATGAASGFFVVDVDKGHGGYESLEQLLHDYSAFPRTPETITGSGGNHILFKYPHEEIRNSQGKLGPGLDIRAEGGYIIAPPSRHPNGNLYQWEYTSRPNDLSLAEAPGWLLDKLRTDPAPAQPVSLTQTPPISPENQTYVSRNTLDFFAHGAAVGTQRSRAVSAARNYLSAGHSLEETTEKVWQGLQQCETEPGREAWTRAQAAYLVNNLHESTPPALPELEGWATKRARYHQGEIEWLVCAAAYLVPHVAKTEMGWLKPEHFTYFKTKHFWRLFLESYDKDHAARESGTLPRLLELVPAIEPHLLGEYAQQLISAGYLTAISSKAQKLQLSIAHADLDAARRLVHEMESEAPALNGRELGTAATGVDKLEEVLENPLNLIKTHIPPIDRHLKGLPLRFHSVWAARPGLGKTTLLLQIAVNVAMSKRRVSLFSLEMSETDLWGKIVCGRLGLDWYAVLAGEITAEQKTHIRRTMDKVREQVDGYLFFDDRPNSTDTIWQAVNQYQPELVIVDHLRLLKDKDENVVQRLGKITARMKEIAKLGNCHVASIHQVNRSVEGRSDKEPQLSDLRDSGLIEEDVDLALFLYRDDYYEKGGKPERYIWTKLITAKDRFSKGKPPRINMHFDTVYEHYDSFRETDPYQNGTNGYHKQEAGELLHVI